MSKAFTRESDDAPEPPVRARPAAVVPPGAKNYLTPEGERRLRRELEELAQNERPPAAAREGEARSRWQAVDQRIAQLQQALLGAVVVPPPPPPHEQVRFGAMVTVRGRHGEDRYRLVGAGETDIDRGWVSWMSPIARALLNARLGQRVRFRFPAGEVELEIVGIEYGKGEG